MKYWLLILYSLFTLSITACSISSISEVLTEKKVVSWESVEGIKRLEESAYKVDFFKLVNHFESQQNKIFCGAASATIVLNTLRVRNTNIELPQDASLLSHSDLKYLTNRTSSSLFNRYTQNNIFLNSPKTREQVLGKRYLGRKGWLIKDIGFQLRQLAGLLKQHGLDITIRVLDQGLEAPFIKHEIIENLKTGNDYVVVNYKRTLLNQLGGGHISPLGAYHQASDSFLIMDVNSNKASWVWVKANLLLDAMRTFDSLENRGYLLIREKS